MKSNKIYTGIGVAVLIIAFALNTSMAQRKLTKARELKENYQYSNALAMYNDHFKNSTPRKAEDIKDIAHCYLMMNDLDAAQQWLSKINTMNVYSPGEMFDYAQALKSNADYDNAIAQFKRFADIFPERSEKLPVWIESCNEAKVWLANPKSFNVVNVDKLNTENSDFGLVPFRDNYIFSSDRVLNYKEYKPEEIFGWTGNPYLKIFSISKLDEDKTTFSPIPASGINTTFHNGPGVFDPSSDRIYYTLTKMQKVAALPTNSDPTSWEEVTVPEKYINRLEIYSARLDNNNWIDIQPFEFNNSEKYSVGHPSISEDGNIMYFVSNMPGGYGNSDIYYCVRMPNSKWSKPVNAGPKINTDGKEVFPVLDQNGTLYFSSDGHPGMGGLDIFQVVGTKNEWSEPVNMTYPINSPKDDFLPYFTEPGVSGYLSSNREGGKGLDDIYYFSKQMTVVVNTKARLKDNSLVPLENVNLIFDELMKKKMFDAVTDEDGYYAQKANCSSMFRITGFKEGYFQQNRAIQGTCINSDTMYVDLILDKIEENKSYVLENIYYDFDKWNIRPDAAKELDKLVKILNEYPNIDIELGSHTDARGSDEYNETLSQKRAESAVAYIISTGISKKRITAKGYGEKKLRNDCSNGVICTDDEHQLNRRTEFTVTKIHDK